MNLKFLRNANACELIKDLSAPAKWQAEPILLPPQKGLLSEEVTHALQFFPLEGRMGVFVFAGPKISHSMPLLISIFNAMLRG
jgi:hypothetical protein